MRNLFLVCLIGIGVMMGCKSSSNQTTVLRGIPMDTIEKQSDDLVKQYLEMDIFSGTVLIAKGNEVLYYKSFGLANRENNIANTVTTKFNIGSINKFFTKVLILQLIEEGKLSSSDTIGKYLHGFLPDISSQVTITQLLNHTSGYGDYMMQPGFFDMPSESLTMDTILESIKTFSLEFAPGTDQMYSNAGYIILGGIIESITEKSYAENIASRITEPLGIKNMVLDESKLTDKDAAIGYMQNMFGEIESNTRTMPPTSAGGFLATAENLLNFFSAYFYSEKLLSEEAKKQDEMYKYIEDAKQNGRAIPIAGGLPGHNSIVFNIPKDSITIIVLANMDEPVAEHLGKGIFAIIKGEKPDAPSKPVIQNVYEQYKQNGIEYVKQHFEELTKNFFPGDPKDMILNNIGYNLLFNAQLDDAIVIFKLNTELFPQIANVWDSYGEALLMTGDKSGALEAYQKALSIRPELPSALEAVKKIKAD